MYINHKNPFRRRIEKTQEQDSDTIIPGDSIHREEEKPQETTLAEVMMDI